MRLPMITGSLCLVVVLGGCGDDPASDGGTEPDAGERDGAIPTADAGLDATTPPPRDAGADAGVDAAVDACVAEAETCDGTDEDCDGLTDEGFDLESDAANCGSCGVVCDDGQVCFAGACGPNVPRALEITAGRAHTCARMTTGEVRCWGANERAQLGQGDITAHSGIVTVMDLPRARQIDAGADHTCAMEGSGVAVCWGDDTFQQIGDGPTGPGYASSPAGVRGGIVGINRVSAGARTSCASSSFGSAFCWGGNANGQIGDGTTMTRDGATSVMRGSALINAMAVGTSHTCALAREAGTPGDDVMCWGQNTVAGEHGDGTFAPHTTPAASLFANATAVEAGEQVTCAVSVGGGVECAGSNARGTLGDGVTAHADFDVFDRSATPVSTGLADVVALSLSFHHACAVSSDGTVRCWGQNQHGQLGDGVATHASCMSPATGDCAFSPVAVTGLADVIDVATGLDHTCALTRGARVFCWGSNAEGQLGLTGAETRTTPTEVLGL